MPSGCFIQIAAKARFIQLHGVYGIRKNNSSKGQYDTDSQFLDVNPTPIDWFGMVSPYQTAFRANAVNLVACCVFLIQSWLPNSRPFSTSLRLVL